MCKVFSEHDYSFISLATPNGLRSWWSGVGFIHEQKNSKAACPGRTVQGKMPENIPESRHRVPAVLLE
jgi:hypothetical protein